jgi:hypothetical protein
MEESIRVTLGEDQLKWVKKYGAINLEHWRSFIINNKQDWFYVGDWKPSNIEPYPSKNDGGYSLRRRNLESNRYFYWPS